MNNIVIHARGGVTNGIRVGACVDVFDRDVEPYNGGDGGLLLW